ncbi:MAG: D-alanyl-D-alanine carboxypeptidase [Blastocatellia bacterium]|nr:D-alanyl-D-alanine carboxypeptidase [Blastocatellia bacterium]
MARWFGKNTKASGLFILLFFALLCQAGCQGSKDASASPPPQAQEPPLPTLQALEHYKETLASRGHDLSSQGVLIETLDSQKQLAEHNSDFAFNPASVMKLATSLVALTRFSPDYRYRTNFLADGPIDPASRKLEGDLVVEGGTDPMFSLADAGEVAVKLSELGISRVTGRLRIAGPFYYFATGYRSNLSRETSAAKLRTALGRAGIRIAGETVFGEKSGTLLVSHYSEELSRILLYQNARSSNAIAEVVGESVGGPQAIQSFLIDKLRLGESDLYVGRASGLEFNRITPRASLKVLRALIEVLKGHSLEPEDVMPVAGIDSGTLRTRLDTGGIRGSVIAKTGTLVSVDNGVSTLVGIAYTRAHGPVLFAIFNSAGSVYTYRRLQDSFVEEMIAEEGGPSLIPRTEDALGGDMRTSSTQTLYGKQSQPAAGSAN